MPGRVYTARDHQRAFELWRQLRSFRAVAREMGADPHTIARWASPDFQCPHQCAWHGWEDLDREIARRAAQELRRGSPGDALAVHTDAHNAPPQLEQEDPLAKYVRDDIELLKLQRALEQIPVGLLRRIIKEIDVDTLELRSDDPAAILSLVEHIQSILRGTAFEQRLILGESTSREEVAFSEEDREFMREAIYRMVAAEREREGGEGDDADGNG